MQYIIYLLSFIVGGVLVYFLLKVMEKKNIALAKESSKSILSDAHKTAEALQREKLLEAKDEILKSRSRFDKEMEERRRDLSQKEKRLQQKEEGLDRKIEQSEKREKAIQGREKELEREAQKITELQNQQRQELEKIAQLSTEEAKNILLSQVEKDLEAEVAVRIKKAEVNFREESSRKAQEIISMSIQKWAADQVVESTISVFNLPGDEMKGRIIGREGRNIRTLETLTGVDLIIDDTPEAVILSSFDPIRREIARMTLEKLVVDGRIHPARIEEMVEKAKKEMEERIRQEGEQAMFQMGIGELHPELVKLLGRLRFRTSYGQNVLQHSLEVGFLAGTIASELGMNPMIAKRAGLLHDIGKTMNMEAEGPHALEGAKMAEKYNESKEVVHAIAAHHEDVEQSSIEAVLVQAADAISAARPGARRESLESYLKRLEKLETVANSFEGVENSFAIQAGREIRIMVKPKVVDDALAAKLAREVVKKIEDELQYPGQIKVTVIREVRAVEYAK